MARAPKPDKKKSSRTIIILCLIVIGVIFAKQSGCKLTERVEKTEWLD